MATGFGNWANTVKVHTVLKQIAQNEIERLRPASRLAEVTKINSDAKTLLVKFVGETNEVLVPFTSVAPSNVGQWVRVGGTTHDRHVEDVIGTTDSESRLSDTENHVNQLMTSILGDEWSKDDDGESDTFLDKINGFFGSLGGNVEGLQELIGSLADNPLGTLEDAKNKISDMIHNAFGLIDPSRIPLLPASHVGANEPNILVNYTFENAITIDGGTDWQWDGVEGHTAPGSARTTGTSSRKVLTSVDIKVAEGQNFTASGWVKWNGVTVAGGNAFQIAVLTYNGDSVVSEYVIQSVTNPAATSGWVEVTGTYTVPANVTSVRLRLIVTSGVQTGTVWFDDMVFRKTGAIQQGLIAGLTSALTNIWSSFTDIFEKITGIPGATISTLTQWNTQLKSILNGISIPGGDLLPTLAQGLKTGLQNGIDTVNNFLLNLANAILAGIRKVPVVGGAIAGRIQDVIDELTGLKNNVESVEATAEVAVNSAEAAQSQIVTIQQVFSVRSNRPLWEGLDPTGESTFPYANLATPAAHTHSVTDNYSMSTAGSHGGHGGGSTTAGSHSHSISGSATALSWGTSEISVANAMTPGGCIRIESLGSKQQITFQARRSGTVASFYLDLYAMNEDGSFKLRHSTPNLAGDLLTVTTWQQAEIPEMMFDLGDVVMVQFRANANTFVAGIQLPAPANAMGFRPLQIGLNRTVSTAPETITRAEADAAYTGYTPYIQIGSNVGQLNAPRRFFDNFNRSILGSSWLANWRSVSGGAYLTVSNNHLVNPTSLMALYQRSGALYTLPLVSDDVAVEWDVVGANEVASGVVICADSYYTNFAMASVTSGGAGIYTNSGGIGGTITNRAGASSTNNNVRWKFQYTSDDDTYRLFKDGSSTPLVKWTDDNWLVGHGKGNRFCGAQIDNYALTTGSPIDNWHAYDLDL